MIKAIVFDCFGVLLGMSTWDIYALAGGDPQEDHQAIRELLYANNAGMITTAEYHKHMGRLLHISGEAYARMARKAESPNERLFAYIRTRLKPQYKIGLLSNANRGVVEDRFTAEQRALFDVIAVSGEIGLLKPDSRAFAYVIDKLGVSYDETVFIDDLRSYVEAANHLGIHGLVYESFEQLQAALPRLLT